MKKVMSLLLIMTMIFSCFMINASAEGLEYILSVEGDTNKVDDIIAVKVQLAGATTLATVGINISYDSTKVVAWDADPQWGGPVTGDTAPADVLYAMSGLHIEETGVFGEGRNQKTLPKWGTEAADVKDGAYAADANKSVINYDLNINSSCLDYTKNHAITDPYAVVTIAFKRIATGDAKFAFEGYDAAASVAGCFVSIGDGSGKLYPTLTNTYEFEEKAEDKFINDTTVTGGAKTITFYGRVGAEWMDEDYGVEFTTNKEGTRAQRYYGAKDNDTVALDAAAGTTQVFSFADWDGTFEIVLTNIADAGNKEYKFFVGDNYTDAAIVVVE